MERSGSELPVVYESPWRALRRDLRAVAASCGLALRRLWRRQWQGDLPLPAFWPRRQATHFWPAVLLLAVVLLALAGSVTVRQWRPAGAQGPAIDPFPAPMEAGEGSREEAAVTFDSAAVMDSAAAGETTPEPKPEPEPQNDVPGTKAASTLSSAPVGLPPGFSDDSGLVLSAPASGGATLLNLQISAAFLTLPEGERQRLAQQWWQQALGLGYEQLRLLEPGGAAVGRTAVVGGGMILLDSFNAGGSDAAGEPGGAVGTADRSRSR
ncbi:hypothetical protein [Synechococcus sp. RedBA-s]|uniref:hypothetical protein n=1 Tax=Synechococcus sp. RedBA-s TaxID=2823741 RepID=UPI0020CDC57C|nr:hypothetical protein [Synechococcus sp. RedBA-s]MCP9799552.1 hypothetical protein [Synechococcus sp. RedBA-s]